MSLQENTEPAMYSVLDFDSAPDRHISVAEIEHQRVRRPSTAPLDAA